MPITIISSDNVSFSVPKAIADVSALIECLNIEDSDTSEPITMGQVDAKTLKKVLAFCEYYLANPLPEIQKPIETNNFSLLVPEWYDTFTNTDHTILFSLAQAANYMDIRPLLDLTCAKIASMIKDKSIEEIRETFGITNDLTPEEEKEMNEEYKWCEETY